MTDVAGPLVGSAPPMADNGAHSAHRPVAQWDARPVRTPNPYLVDLAAAGSAARHLEEHATQILGVLTEFESFEAAQDELERSIHTLRNLHREAPYLRRLCVPTIAVFLPINLPLYSLILFAAVPSLMADKVDVRAPAATPQWLADVYAAADISCYFPRVHLHNITRRSFVEEFAQKASVVIFTGRYENARLVERQCPDSLFIYEGSGVNPIVVGPAADIARDIQRLTTPRLFNGGQDCAGPDAYLVHRSVLGEFQKQLDEVISGLSLGNYDDPNVRVGPILNKAPLRDVAVHLTGLAARTTAGGSVDMQSGVVEPTVIVQDITDHVELTEFFAPIFYVLVYDEPEQLHDFFSAREYTDHAMYVSFFGAAAPPICYETSTVLLEQTVLEVEQGNTAYGGYGPRANYVAQRSETLAVMPILISECLAQSFNA